jgi:hypothetical protein
MYDIFIMIKKYELEKLHEGIRIIPGTMEIHYVLIKKEDYPLLEMLEQCEKTVILITFY